MPRKFMRVLILFVFLVVSLFPASSFAADKKIKIYVDDKQLSADQAPVIIGGRVLVPLRSIFEALDSKVSYSAKTKTISAQKGGTNIEIKIGSPRAKINSQGATMDVPAQILNSRTLVPIRFVSTALGSEVAYSHQDKRVDIKSASYTVSELTASDTGNFGDARDMNVSFKQPGNHSAIDFYRLIAVKTSKAAAFNVNNAFRLPANRYLDAADSRNTVSRNLSYGTLDSDGEIIRNDISYTIFVISVSHSRGILGSSSAAITLQDRFTAGKVSGVKLKDASDYGDGRDIEMSFSRLSDEYGLDHYRAIIVKSSKASSFDLSAALQVPSSYYTAISKNGQNIKQTLASSTRDSDGTFIQEGIKYKLFVVSIGDRTWGFSSSLSSPSSDLTLISKPEEIRASSVSVKDTSDFGDGRDLQVSFKPAASESRVSEYRVMVVKASDASYFSLAKASYVSSSNYTRVNKTGADITLNLQSGTRDVDGNYIQQGIPYRVFIFTAGSQGNDYKNSLSSASGSVTLANNILASAVSNVKASDIGDLGDGRDLEITFNKASKEDNITSYRILVIKSSQAASFNLAAANSVASRNYTTAAKTGGNIRTSLSAAARDVYGEVIREGVAYKVFVLSVSSGGNTANNSLSSASPVVTLEGNSTADPVGNVQAADVADTGNSSDIEISFTKAADESKITEYRIIAVKTAEASSFNLARANGTAAANYTRVTKTGGDIVKRLASNAKDANGELIRTRESYKFFVLSVSAAGNPSSNALSLASQPLLLLDVQVNAAAQVTAADISNNGNGSDLNISFNKPSDDSGIIRYEIMIVKESDAAGFDLNTANAVRNNINLWVEKNQPSQLTLRSDTVDISGRLLQPNIDYKVFVLAIADGITASRNNLSAPSNTITLTTN
ncbi:copper amine oxidase N-terminal domain-containing protein [Bacillus infantis]|uniref:copper amine oxidase N-terminal domain-containing protein n=1 Tax=Bacillus infantis TaxID=324767 RepID=UPI001CD51C27|nr:copper amine oxidase N-terminal domain-containing protein [Bacillus infantis]MCA1040946.1 copper amine oxidase N-terminal domain-containing protein [Bacillus infantis]